MSLWTEPTWRQCGVSATDGVLVALSGGADSAALLLELHKLQKNGRISRLEAAHLHHGIRGKEADADADFVRSLCERLSVPLILEYADVPNAAKETGESLELAARRIRYAFLERARTERGLSCIATGHHRDDQAETLLLHLLRGTGTDGLAGMRARTGHVIRPLLYTSKEEILAYLSERGETYCTDSTNFVQDATRNRIRHTVIPALETVNPAAKKALAEAAAHVAEDADYLNELAAQAKRDCGSDRKKLSALPRPIRLRVLRDMLPYRDYTAADMERLDALLSGQTGDTATLKNGVAAWLDADSLRIGIQKAEAYAIPVPDTGSVRLPNGTLFAERVGHANIPCGGNDAYIDADRLVGTVTVRSPKEGDRFTPLGMHGSKLLSDYFTDRKVPRYDRHIPIVCDEAGIVFAAGYTVDERMRVSADSTNILHYHYEED